MSKWYRVEVLARKDVMIEVDDHISEDDAACEAQEMADFDSNVKIKDIGRVNLILSENVDKEKENADEVLSI